MQSGAARSPRCQHQQSPASSVEAASRRSQHLTSTATECARTACRPNARRALQRHISAGAQRDVKARFLLLCMPVRRMTSAEIIECINTPFLESRSCHVSLHRCTSIQALVCIGKAHHVATWSLGKRAPPRRVKQILSCACR